MKRCIGLTRRKQGRLSASRLHGTFHLGWGGGGRSINDNNGRRQGGSHRPLCVQPSGASDWLECAPISGGALGGPGSLWWWRRVNTWRPLSRVRVTTNPANRTSARDSVQPTHRVPTTCPELGPSVNHSETRGLSY